MNIRNLLIESMRSLSCKELQHFDKFLRSPYFKKEHFNNAKIYQLFKILKLYFFHLPENKNYTPKHLPIVNWEKIFIKLFPAITCSEEKQKRLSKLCSELIRYILDFLAVESFLNQKIDFQISVASQIEKKNLSSLFEHNWKVKYFNGIYSEDEIQNIYHRYLLIRTSNLHKEKYEKSRPDYELELMLLRKYEKMIFSDIYKRAETRDINRKRDILIKTTT